MRVFISSDIEGTCFTTIWDETRKNSYGYDPAAAQMTAETKAACDGAIDAGADYIRVKDAHGSATNMDITKFPRCVETVRGWTGSPKAMVEGIDESFDAALFIGYHSAAGRNGNPLSHTYTGKTNRIRLNGQICTEFLLYSYCCAMYGVPTVFLSGDKMLTEDMQGIHPLLKTVYVKDGYGAMTLCKNPQVVCDEIRATVAEALSQDLSKGKIELPKHFVLDITYHEHKDAVKYSYYPGFIKTDECTIRLETDNFEDVLRSVPFVF